MISRLVSKVRKCITFNEQHSYLKQNEWAIQTIGLMAGFEAIITGRF
jgi:hypothetical protein